MINAQEMAYALYGAFRLARFDARGLDFFGNTVEAFWRSFFAAVIVAPGYALMVMFGIADMPMHGSVGRVILVQIISYVIRWVAFPLAMFYLADALGRQHRYLRYIIAYNWASVLQITLFVCVLALTASGLLPDGIATFVRFAVTIAIFVYIWFIARVGLAVSGIVAAGVVLLDVVISVLLVGVTGRMT